METQNHLTALTAILLLSIIYMSACEVITDSTYKKDIEESLEFIPSLTHIEGAGNTTVTVNRSNGSYFSLDLDGIGQTSIIGNGSSFEGWCIDYDKPINSDGGIYEGLQLYSSYLTKAWKPLNYFLNIKDALKQEDPELTFRDIQVVIWSLMPYPDFDMDKISDDEFPGRVMQNGERNFDEKKVARILELVEMGYRDFHYGEGSRFAIVIDTPSDVQTVITVSE